MSSESIVRVIKIIIITFVINNAVGENEFWHSYQFDTGFGNREEVSVSKIIAQENFTVNYNVTKWKSAIGTVTNQNLAIGLTKTGIVILSIKSHKGSNDSLIYNSTYIELQSEVQDAIFYSQWNTSSNTLETILIVATESDNHASLNWIRFSEKSKIMKQFWSWHIHRNIQHLNIIPAESKILIFYRSSTDIYNYNVKIIQFSLAQTLTLETSTDNSAIHLNGNEIFLSIPQEDHVRILSYNNQIFAPFKNITCTLVEHTTGFNIGSQAFLAIDGLNSGIYKFTRRTLVKQPIKNANLEGSNYWLRIPIDNYRQEDMLLAQRNLSHGQHDSLMMEVISYDSGSFATHDEVECDYFGDVTWGLNCVFDDSHSSFGVEHAGVISNGELIALVISHRDGSSSLYRLKLEKSFKPSVVQVEVDRLKQQRERIEEAISNLHLNLNSVSQKEPEPEIVKQTPVVDNWNNKPEKMISDFGIEQLRKAIEETNRVIEENNVILENRRHGRFDTLIINGLLEVHGDSNVQNVNTKMIDNVEAGEVFEDIARIDNIRKLVGNKEFHNLQVENLTFQSVNGINSDEILYKTEPVKLNGDFIFENSVIIKGNVTVKDGFLNGIILQEDIVEIGKPVNGKLYFENLQVLDTLQVDVANKFPIHNNYLETFTNFDKKETTDLQFDNLYLPGNLTVNTVNNVDFNDFIKSLCFTNLKTYIPGTTNITKKLTIEKDSKINYLNDLKFPEKYVFQNSKDFIQFTGFKNFSNVVADEATASFLNGIDPATFVTLTGDQNLDGKFIFEDIEITEELIVDGKISGNKDDMFIPNPTLNEVNLIKANVNFKNIIVQGNVFVKNEFNGTNFKDGLSKIIHKDQLDVVVLQKPKQFSQGVTVTKNLQVSTNEINNLNINNIVSKSVEDVFNFPQINGNVEIENLEITGLLNSCNMTKLERETVKLSGDQFITTKLSFEEDITISNLLEIRDNINGLTEKDFVYTIGDRIIDSVDIDEIIAENVVVKGNLETIVENFNLEEFDRERLSFSKDQNFVGNVFADNIEAIDIHVDFINDHAYQDLFSVESYSEKLAVMFLQGKLSIENLIVEDSLNVTKMNGLYLNSEIFSKCIWNSGSNRYNDTVVFIDDIFAKNVVIEKFNDVPFQEFSDNIVYKNETVVKLAGLKSYVNGFNVHNYIKTGFINDIDVRNVLRKTGDQDIQGPVNIVGDVLLENVEILDSLNGVSIHDFMGSFEKVSENCLKINGDVMFNRFVEIEQMNVRGLVNSKNVTKHFINLVNVNEKIYFPGKTIFENSVFVKGNVDIKENLNGINLEKYIDDVVYLTTDAEFEDIVTFENPVVILDRLFVKTDLISRYVSGIDMKYWLENTTYINAGIITGNVIFDDVIVNGNVLTNFVNDVNMSSLIQLRSDQIINEDLSIDEIEVFRNVDVLNLVNGMKLEPELQNTVMNDKDNFVTSPLTFQENIVVRDELEISTFVNNRQDFSKIVTTDTNQILSGSYIFASTSNSVFEEGFSLTGLVNGINLTDWFVRGVKKSVEYPQELHQKIYAKGIVFEKSVIGGGVVNGFDVRAMADQVAGKQILKKEIEEKLIGNYPHVCNDVNYALKQSRNQMYSLKYLDNVQFLDFTNNVETIYNFKFQENYYMLVHEDGSCMSHLFTWANSLFQHLRLIETGSVSQFISVDFDDDNIFLVSRSSRNESKCAVEGSNLWQFDPEEITLMLMYNIEPQILLQESLVPQTFYGILKNRVVEYKIRIGDDFVLEKYRKWKLLGENLAFIPRDLHTGLAVRDGSSIYKLIREDPIIDNNFAYDFESAVLGRYKTENNTLFPGRKTGEIAVLNVGSNGKTVMVATIQFSDMNNRTLTNSIKIYDNIKTASKYQEIPALNPSSLLSMNLQENGETLLMFFENKMKLQVYEYKGIFGFVQRFSVDIEGSKIVTISLPKTAYVEQKYIGIINKKRITILETVMEGSRITESEAICRIN